MAGINLLPTDLAPRASVVKASGVIRKLTTLGVILLLLSLGVSIGLFLIFSNQLKEVTARKEQLEANIKALQATEQRLVLIKDRLALAQEVFARPSGSDEVAAVKSLISAFSEEVSVKQFEIKSEVTTVSFETQNSLALTQMMATVASSGNYKQVNLTSISFTPLLGFSTDFELIK